jgi:16S rRNA processing protein RimM
LGEASNPERLTIASIRRVRGNRGEVAAEVLTDFPERFEAGVELLLSRNGTQRTLALDEAWFHKGMAILKFRGFDSISAAEELVGWDVQIPLSSRKELPAGEVYLSDLVGCSVLENGEILGTVDSIEQTGAAPLLSVHTESGEILIPFVMDICRTVDVVRREVHVTLPEGLKDINR